VLTYENRLVSWFRGDELYLLLLFLKTWLGVIKKCVLAENSLLTKREEKAESVFLDEGCTSRLWLTGEKFSAC